jgi:hypothetical protein
MPTPIDAMAAEEPPSEAATPVGAPAGWKLVETAPEPDVPLHRDRRGAQRGMALLLVGGGLFWLAVAAALVLASR